MTGIIAVKTSPGNNPQGIVIGSDRQETYSDEDERPLLKRDIDKIICGKGWVLAYASASLISPDDHPFFRFVRTLMGDKRVGSSPDKSSEIITNTIKNYHAWVEQGKKYRGLHFEEVAFLNAAARRAGAKYEDLSNFILATNSPDFGLWEVDEFGNLIPPGKEKEFEWVCIGSGSRDIEKHIVDLTLEGKIDSDDISISKAIKIVRGALEKAQRDIYTGSFIDLVVLTNKQEPEKYGENIRQAMRRAYEDEVLKIEKKYERIEQEPTDLEKKML